MKILRFVLLVILFITLWMFLHFSYIGVSWLLLSKESFIMFYYEAIILHVVMNTTFIIVLGFLFQDWFDENFCYKK